MYADDKYGKMSIERKKKIIIVDEDDACECESIADDKKETPGKVFSPPVPRLMSRGYWETKYYQDSALSSPSTLPTGNFYSLCTLGEGLDFYQRLGREVKFTDVEMSFDATANNTTSSVDQIRCMVVLDTMPKAAVPVVSSLLDIPGTTPYLWYLLNKKDYRDRFHVLIDFKTPVLNFAAPRHGETSFKKHWKIPKNRSIATYSTTTPDLPESNSILIFMCNANSTNPAAVSWTARAYFRDS